MMYILFVLFWVILNGKFTWEILLFGLGIGAAIYLFVWKFMGLSPKKEMRILVHVGSFVLYFIILIREILFANIILIKMIMHPGKKLKPVIVNFDVPIESQVLRTILADSITLTPGTITVGLNGGELTVHCLDETMAKDLDCSIFVKQLKKWESRGWFQ